jgi:hypothetical protein
MNSRFPQFAARATRCALAVALLALGPGACSSGTSVAELQIVQTAVIDFGALEGDRPSLTADGALPFDLREEADWVRLHPGFRCVALDTTHSAVVVSRLLSPGLDTMLTLQVDVMPRGGVTWKPLIELNGTVADGASISWSDPSVTIFPDGVDLLEAIALSLNPGYELRVTGEVPTAVDDLVINLLLELDFSTLADGCPHAR